MIQVKKIVPQTVEFFDPTNKSIGFLNLFEFMDLRIQIKKEQVAGYYAIFEGHEIEISKYGRQLKFVPGFFDLWDDQMDEFLDL